MKSILSLALVVFILLPSVLAITGEIGNARAVISRDWNGRETIERTILVRNPNNVSVDIKLEPSDEIKDIVELIDKEFELQPGEEKKARFNLKITEQGQWNGRINVFFRPEEGNSVVLASTIILLVGDEFDDEDIVEETQEENQDEILEQEDEGLKEDDDADDGNNGVDFGIKGAQEDGSNTGLIVLVIVIFVVVVAAIIGFIFLFKR